VYRKIALHLSAFGSLKPNARWLTGICLWTAILSGCIFSQENYSTWSDSQRVYINTTSSGANVANAVANFPVLIRLNPTNFTRFSRTKPLGADIRFATSSGVHLNYQIERWVDGANNADTAEIWVKVPSVTGNNNTQFIRMYYGKANAADSSNGRMVFETANGFIGVWHLAEDPAGGAAGAIKDATANALNATAKGSMTSGNVVGGIIGKAHNFDGADDADSIPYASALNTADAVTLSAWVNVRKFQTYSRIISRGMPRDSNPWTVYSLNTFDTFPRWRGEASSGDTNSQKFVHGKGNLSINTWYHVAFTYDKSNLMMYRNGVLDSVSVAATIGMSTGQTTPLMIGKSNYGTNPFNGIIDEAAVAKVARSADWIKLSYETQKPTASCISVEAAVAPAITTQPAGSSVLVGANATMTVAASGTAPLWYEWYKDSVVSAKKITGQTSATLSLTNIQITDSGNYICVVHNEYGFAQSNPAKLTVTSPNSPPSIITQPKDTTVYQTMPMMMSILATGAGTLSYQWYKVANGQNVELPGQDIPSLYVASTQLTDSGLFRCIVTNAYGSTPSNTAKLTVLSGAPAITVNPKDTIVVASTLARMRVTATGLGTLTYAWYKNTVSAGTLVAGQITATLTIAIAQLSDAGNYLCVVTNDYGSDTSLPGKLTVNNGSPIITVQPRDTAVLETKPWSMSVTATGVGTLSYAWYKTGDAAVKGTNSTFSISAASTTDNGTYYCIVTNTFGACTSSVAAVSVTSNPQIHNPIMLAGALVDSTHVLLSVKRYSALVALVPDQFFPWSPDTVLIWYRSGSYPTSTAVNQIKLRISKARLQAAGGDQFDTIVTVPKIGCESYYFKGSVKWRNTSVTDDSIPPLGDNTTGATVTMCDNSLLIVPLTMSFVYAPPNDSVVVSISGLTTPGIRWDLVTSVVLRYSVAQSTFIEIPINPSVMQGIGDVYAQTVRNTRFAGDTTTVKWQLSFRGINNNPSDTVKAESKVGAMRPDNSLTLSASKIDALQVTLSWINNTGTPYDSFQIWYATTPIPDTNPSPSVYTSQGAAGTAATALVRNLKELTTYHFGIQGMRAGIWSLIPMTAKTNATTLEDTSKAIPNTMKILGVAYDSNTYKIRITYRIDQLEFQHRVGFSWVQRSQGAPPLPEEFAEPVSSPRVGEITYTDSLGKITIYEFEMASASPALNYAMEYYFGGWVSKVGEKWALPTDTSIFYYAIPQPKVVPAVLFKNTEVVTAFNNQVVLRKVDGVEQPVILRLIDGLPIDVSGLVPVSIAFKLETNVTSPIALMVGLKYNAGLIPAGANETDVRMYHYDTARAIWLLDTATIVNVAAESVMYIKKYLSDCTYPFILAVDIIKPTITVTADTGAVSLHDSIPMTVMVDDNIANPQVSMYLGEGKEELRLYKALTDIEVTRGVLTPWVVDTNYVQGETGIRIHVTANDGRNSTLADVSRDIRFSDADAANTIKEVWIPLGSTGVLDSPGVKQALKVYGSTPGSWKYDIYRLRLCRYIKKDWLEYSEAKQDSFSFVPGRVIWLKTRVDTVYDFGNGHSVSLKSPYTINLPAKSWTDFCLPYRFDIRIGDVLKANDDPLVATSLHFYKWEISEPNGRYYGKEFYLPIIGVSKLTDTLYYQGGKLEKVAYTVWNNHTADIVLKIPGTPLALSTVGVGAHKAAAQSGSMGWSVAVRSSAPDGDLSPVFCAYVKGGGGTLAYPQPPTWSKVNVGIYDRERREVCGNLITREIENGGYTYELVFANDYADRTRVSYTVERLAGESAVEIAVIDPATGTVAAGESSLSVEVAGNSSEYRLLAIGSPGYIDGFGQSLQRGSFALSRISPNPFKGMVRIEYMVPYGGIETVRCDIINHLGRVVWSVRPQGRIHPGRNSVVWTPDRKSQLSSGAYFIRLVGYDGKGRKTGEKTAKVLYLH
jgi:hypothetical protein